MAGLTASYEKTLNATKEGKPADARAEYHAQFVPTVKKLYTETAETYPLRFAKASNWCVWAKGLYTMSVKTDQALAGADAKAAGEQLGALREHVYNLHVDTQTQKVNDAIYAFRVEAMKDQPSAAQLKKLREAVTKAEPSVKAKADPAAFGQACAQWNQQVDGILNIAQLAAADLPRLRAATEAFYLAFGVQFE